MPWKFTINEVSTPYKFIRKDITLSLDDNTYSEFYDEFHKFFFDKKITNTAFSLLERIIAGDPAITIEERNYLRNSLKRTFDQKDEYDLQGQIGENLLPFYYRKESIPIVNEYGPKGLSSKEPGIDYIVFFEEKNGSFDYKFIVWEIKTTQNEVSSRVSEINKFFDHNGSFDENIDSSIREIQQDQNITNTSFKDFITNLSVYVLRNDTCFNIGGCIVSSQSNCTKDTFKSFQEKRAELSKDQRFVKIIIFNELKNLVSLLMDNSWNKL